MNESYPAKTAYKKRVAAQEYDIRRFKSLKGRYMDKKERASLTAAIEHLLSKKSGQEPDLALDAPCGTGRMIKVIRDIGIPVIGVDISFQMLQQAKEQLANSPHKVPLIGLVQCDIEALPFKDDAFDISSCVRLMGHLPKPVKYRVIRELLRTSREGIAITFYKPGIRQKIKRFVKKLFGNRAPWYPMNDDQILELARKCMAGVSGRFYVHRLVSDGVTYILTKKRP